MKEKEEAIQLMKVFNEKADKLLGSNFIKNMIGSGVRISGKVGEPVIAERTGPSEENIDAAVLTLRFFIQDNEASFRRLSCPYASLPLSKDLKESFLHNRKVLNDFLDQYPGIRIEIDGEIPTNREILYVFVYGGLAHATPDKKKVYDSWRVNSIMFALLQNEFTLIIYSILQVVAYTKNLNEKAMAELSEAAR